VYGFEKELKYKEIHISGWQTLRAKPSSLAMTVGWLWLVGSIKLYVSFAEESYKTAHILQKRPIILSILLTVATP